LISAKTIVHNHKIN